MLAAISLIGGSCGDGPVDPKNPPPVIRTFTFFPSSILVLDSTFLIWNVEHADSMRIIEMDTTIRPADSGRIVLHPQSPLTYTAVAYNSYGRDTVVTSLAYTVVPFRIQPKSSAYFRGEYGSTTYTPDLTFVVSDSTGRPLPDTTVYFSLISGDGTLLTDSGLTDANGEVTAAYEFTGVETEAQLRANFADVDSTDVRLRVNALRFNRPSPLIVGQAQCVLFSDTYADVFNFNGPPDSVSHTPGDSALVAEYDRTLGVVFVISDANDDGIPDDTGEVLGAAVVDSIFPIPGGGFSARYTGTDEVGVGIGSDYDTEVRGLPGSYVYGNADAIKVDTSIGSTPEISVIAAYDTLKAWFWCFEDNAAAKAVFEIDMYEFVPDHPAAKSAPDEIVSRVLSHYREQKALRRAQE